MKYKKLIILALLPLSMWANNMRISAWESMYLPSYPTIEEASDTLETNDSVSISHRRNYSNVDVEIREKDNSTTIVIHKDGDTIRHYEMNYNFSDETACHPKKEKKISKTFSFGDKGNKNRFKGHWAGFEMGLNNYLTSSGSQSPEESYMEINTGKSWNFNLNFAQYSIPLVRDRFGMVTGLGIEWSNYHFSNNNTIVKDADARTVVEAPLTDALKKNRLQTTYLTCPLLMEVQLGGSSKRLSVSAGVIGGLKLGSHTKYKTSDSKKKNKDDFYLQSFRYGYTARINYESIGLYFNYYDTPLFLNGQGPELYPFAAGVVFSFN